LAAARRRDRFLIWALIVMLVSFGLAAGFGLLGFVSVVFAGMVTFAASFLAAMVGLFAGRGRRPCRQCGRRMQFAWRPIGGGRDAEYLTCEHCRRYVATSRTSV